MTGTSKVARSSLTASRPELPSASWMSARIRPGRLALARRDRLGMGAGDADHPVTEGFHQTLQVEGDEGLVLDDQDVGGDLLGQFAAGLFHQATHRLHVEPQDMGGILLGKTFQRDQQEGLARPAGSDCPSRRSAASPPRLGSGVPLSGIEFQIVVNSRNRETRGFSFVSRRLGSLMRASRVAAT